MAQCHPSSSPCFHHPLGEEGHPCGVLPTLSPVEMEEGRWEGGRKEANRDAGREEEGRTEGARSKGEREGTRSKKVREGEGWVMKTEDEGELK